MKWLFLLLLVPTQFVLAQSKPAQVYAYVEQMPELPGGGGHAAVVAEVMKRMHLSSVVDDGNTRYSGIRFAFIVNPDGTTRDVVMMTSSNNRAIDQAILAAVHQLPKFKPGKQDGQSVPVRLTLTISCIKLQ
jgi:protein TonB